ncbi:MAG: helix-hairpin-helix domain-containing protein [bacterium]|nr:helix-hairpin-helix domain-containing protein [bacterium]
MDSLKKLKTLFINNFCFTPQERNLLVFVALALLTGFMLHVASPDDGVETTVLSGNYKYTPVELEKPPGSNSPSNSLSSLYINRITKEELITINSIGEKTAQNIIEFREKNGPLTSCEDLLAIPGIGEKRLLKIKEFIENISKK